MTRQWSLKGTIYTEELSRKDLNELDYYDGVVSHPEPDILECKVKWALRSTAVNKASGCKEIPAAAAAKSLQSCLTLCDPTDCSLPGFSVHGIFQARVPEWGAIAFYGNSSRNIQIPKEWYHQGFILIISANLEDLLWPQDWKMSILIQFPRRVVPKNLLTIR